jgi:hypothetical protein
MQYDAIAAELTRLDYRWLLRVRALCTARRRCVLKGGMAATWPAAHHPRIVRLGRAVRSACFPAAVTLGQY